MHEKAYISKQDYAKEIASMLVIKIVKLHYYLCYSLFSDYISTNLHLYSTNDSFTGTHERNVIYYE